MQRSPKVSLDGSITARSFLVLILCMALPAVAQNSDGKEQGFKPIFNGKDMSAFVLVKAPAETWSIEDSIIRCKGRPNGYFATKKSYKNYILRLDFRYPRNAGNSGYLLNITGEHKVWPKCIEVQGQYQGVCTIFPIGGAKGPRPKVDSAAREKARKPHTEWNSVEIVMNNGAITAKLNGVTIAQSQPYDLKEGPIGFQSEGAPIDFRKIRIKELPN